MLHAHTKSNGIHKSRANGENGHGSIATLVQPQLAEEIHRLMTAVRSGQVNERAQVEGFEPEECELLEEVNQALDAVTAPLALAGECLGRIGQGEVPEKINADFPGELNTVKTGLNACVDALGGLVEANRVMRAMAVNDCSVLIEGGYPGIFGELCGASQLAQQRVINTVRIAKEIAAGNFTGELETLEKIGRRSEKDELVPTLVVMMRSLGALLVDNDALAKGAVDGKLATRADASRHQGDYRRIIAGMNGTLDAVVGPLEVAASYVDQISQGRIPAKISETYNGEFNAIKNNLNTCIDALNGLVEAMARMSDAHNAGDIDVVIPVDKFAGVYQTMAQGVNTMVEGHITVKKKAMACIAEFSQGNFDAALEKFPGKKAFINDNIERLRTNIKSLVAEMARMSDAHNAGDIDVVIPLEKFAGTYQTMARGVNEMVQGHITVKKKAMACIAEFSQGNFDAELEKFPGKKAFINENIERLRANIKAFVAEMARMSEAHTAGDIDVIIPLEKFAGIYQVMARGVNEMVQGHITVKKKAMACIAEFGKGNFEAPLEKFPGKKAFINDTIEEVRVHLKALMADAEFLVQAAMKGQLSTRADVVKHGGDFRKIVEGVNATLDAVIGPLQDVGGVLDKMAGGDLTVQVVNQYAGDFDRLKNTVNTVASQVRAAIQQIGVNASSLVSAAEELNRVSQQMSASADETATQANVVSAASEQVATNMQTVATGADEMGASIKEIAKNTADATRVATAAVRSAETTNVTIGKLGQSSAEIGQVIKVITSIAQQTNLLALNATIEAARAGEAGKGFAVVANEVKELAKETAKATEDISRKIEAIQTDTKGAVEAIGQIGAVIVQINDIQNTIASAVEEQSATTNEISRNLAEAAHGSSDITKNITGVAEAAHCTTAGAADTQKSAQSLERMATELQGLVAQFKY